MTHAYETSSDDEPIIDPAVRTNARIALAAYQKELRAAVLELQIRAESPPNLAESQTPEDDTDEYRGDIAVLRVLVEQLDMVDRVMRDVFHSTRPVLNLRSALLRAVRVEREFLESSGRK